MGSESTNSCYLTPSGDGHALFRCAACFLTTQAIMRYHTYHPGRKRYPMNSQTNFSWDCSCNFYLFISLRKFFRRCGNLTRLQTHESLVWDPPCTTDLPSKSNRLTLHYGFPSQQPNLGFGTHNTFPAKTKAWDFPAQIAVWDS